MDLAGRALRRSSCWWPNADKLEPHCDATVGEIEASGRAMRFADVCFDTGYSVTQRAMEEAEHLVGVLYRSTCGVTSRRLHRSSQARRVSRRCRLSEGTGPKRRARNARTAESLFSATGGHRVAARSCP